jgi:hypothetical protein
MIELEADKKKKIMVVNIIFCLACGVLAGFYYAKNMFDLEKLLQDTIAKLMKHI